MKATAPVAISRVEGLFLSPSGRGRRRPRGMRRVRGTFAFAAPSPGLRCAWPTSPRWGEEHCYAVSSQARTHNSLWVQPLRRHAVRPISNARCPLAKHEDAASVELGEIRAIAEGDSAAFQRLI